MNSNYSSQAKQKLNQIKMEAANEVGVNLNQGYNGELTSRQAGSIGGQMVKNILPEQNIQITKKKMTIENHSITYILKYNISI